jgi:hypothetical protein
VVDEKQGWTFGRTADMAAEDCMSAYRGKVAVQRA